MAFDSILACVQEDFLAFEQDIYQQLHSEAKLVEVVSKYLIDSGGKRLRPLVAILAAKACGYEGQGHITIATVVEYLHTATLLHDDVVDQSQLRRGKTTANLVWNNSASILVGDFLISRAFELIVDLKSLEILKTLSSATNIIAEGEILQLSNCNNPGISLDDYLDVITKKTAKMFEVAAECSGVLAAAPQQHIQALKSYANHLGIAFQLMDDLLDYTGSQALGKNLGDDLAEGKTTLPLIYALQSASESEQQLLKSAIQKGSLEQLEAIIEVLQKTNALAKTEALARAQAQKAIEALMPLGLNPFTQALKALANLSIDRDH